MNSFMPVHSEDSSYKPFITGLKRKPTTDMNQFTALVGTLLVLKAVEIGRASCRERV